MRLCLIPYLHTFFFFSLFFGGDSLYRRFILTSATKPIKKTGNGITIFNKYMHVLLTCASLIAM